MTLRGRKEAWGGKGGKKKHKNQQESFRVEMGRRIEKKG